MPWKPSTCNGICELQVHRARLIGGVVQSWHALCSLICVSVIVWCGSRRLIHHVARQFGGTVPSLAQFCHRQRGLFHAEAYNAKRLEESLDYFIALFDADTGVPSSHNDFAYLDLLIHNSKCMGNYELVYRL